MGNLLTNIKLIRVELNSWCKVLNLNFMDGKLGFRFDFLAEINHLESWGIFRAYGMKEKPLKRVLSLIHDGSVKLFFIDACFYQVFIFLLGVLNILSRLWV